MDMANISVSPAFTLVIHCTVDIAPDLNFHRVPVILVSLAGPINVVSLAALINLVSLAVPIHRVGLEVPVNLVPLVSPSVESLLESP